MSANRRPHIALALRLISPSLREHAHQPLGVEPRRTPEEAATKRKIDLLHRLVDQVHRPDDVKALRELDRAHLTATIQARQVDATLSIFETENAWPRTRLRSTRLSSSRMST